jgi:hypothetical protein
MLSISHSVTGAFIASKFPNPLVYVPLTLATHYLEDWIPHWDVGTGLSNGKRKRLTAFLLEWIDLAATVALVYIFWQKGADQIQYHVWAGAFTGLIPDFVEAPRNFLHWEPFFLKPLNKFHASLHHSVENIIFGLTPQIMTIGLIWFLR